MLPWRIPPSFFLVDPSVDTKDRTLLAASSLILSWQVSGDDLWRKNSIFFVWGSVVDTGFGNIIYTFLEDLKGWALRSLPVGEE